MNISRIALLFLVISCLFLGACAPNNPQLGLRGNPNSPWTNMQKLQADPNYAMSLSPQQRTEYYNGIRMHNDAVAYQLRNDQQAARNAQTWTGNVNQDRYSTQNIVRRNADDLIRRFVNSIDFN